MPTVIHPVIILRLLCHKLFGNRLRRKDLQMKEGLQGAGVAGGSADSGHPKSGTGTPQKNHSTKRVQITEPEKIVRDTKSIIHARKRAGSVDKCLLKITKKRGFQSSLLKITNRDSGWPDLSMTAKLLSLDSDENKTKRFRFPSLRKRISKSQGNLLSGHHIGFGSVDSRTHSTVDLNTKIKAFQKELINLPKFEIDTSKYENGPSIEIDAVDFTSSPTLGRAVSVPDRLGSVPITHDLLPRSPIRSPQSSVSGNSVNIHMPLGDCRFDIPDSGVELETHSRVHQIDSLSSATSPTGAPTGEYSPDRGLQFGQQRSDSLPHSLIQPDGSFQYHHHQGVLRFVQKWMDNCSVDLLACPQLRTEMKEFLHHVSTLGGEFHTWSTSMQQQLSFLVKVFVNFGAKYI